MVLKKSIKYIVIALIAMIVIISAVTLLRHIEKNNDNQVESQEQISNARNIIEDCLKIYLPDSQKIVNFTYYKEDGCFDAKINIEEQDIESVKKELNKYFIKEINNPYTLHHFENVTSWWDLKKENIKVAYDKLTGAGSGTASDPSYTRDVWAFIVKDEQGKYYLYISY